MPILSEQFIVEIWGHYFCIKNVWVDPSFWHKDDVWGMGVNYLPKALLLCNTTLCVNNNYWLSVLLDIPLESHLWCWTGYFVSWKLDPWGVNGRSTVNRFTMWKVNMSKRQHGGVRCTKLGDILRVPARTNPLSINETSLHLFLRIWYDTIALLTHTVYCSDYLLLLFFKTNKDTLGARAWIGVTIWWVLNQDLTKVKSTVSTWPCLEMYVHENWPMFHHNNWD